MFVLVVAMLACVGTPEAPPSEPPRSAPGIDVRDGSVSDLVAQLSASLGRGVLVDAAALPVARCARLTLVIPADSHPETTEELSREVLKGVGLSLDRGVEHYAIGKIEGAPPPPGCGDPEPADEGGEVVAIDGIRQLTEDTWEVDVRSAAFAGGSDALMRQARLVPRSDGPGVRIYGVRPRTVPGALGLKNGDVVLKIGDVELDGLDAALRAFTAAKSSDEVVVAIERRGQPVVLRYRLIR